MIEWSLLKRRLCEELGAHVGTRDEETAPRQGLSTA
jgi:hypothetical protein